MASATRIEIELLPLGPARGESRQGWRRWDVEIYDPSRPKGKRRFLVSRVSARDEDHARSLLEWSSGDVWYAIRALLSPNKSERGAT